MLPLDDLFEYIFNIFQYDTQRFFLSSSKGTTFVL